MSEWRVKMCVPEPEDPFAMTELKVEDVGYSEKVLIVDGSIVSRARAEERKRSADMVRDYEKHLRERYSERWHDYNLLMLADEIEGVAK